MAFEPREQLLQYRLIEKIGEGGMGVVWKAVDTDLGREAAIKFLPAAFAAEPERLARFEREARLLATLNHPGIAAVYGLHEHDTSTGSVRFLAMELVQGEDLSVRLSRGGLPVDDALELADEICEALQAAHDAGVIHRDLKPANVMLTPDNKVKILDFGLAKAMTGDPASGSGVSASLSPTMTSAGTQIGMILGTAGYMSPEQARGRTADRRADVWAFGCVLFEMLAGVKPFDGETVTDTLAAIVRAEPAWELLAGKVPDSVVALLKRCLQKDPRVRLRSMGDIGLTLKELAAEGSVQRVTETRRGLSPALAAGALLAVAVVAAGLGSWFSRAEPVVESQRRFSIELAEETFIPAGVGSGLTISRDGTRLVYLAENLDHRMLYLRDIDDFKSRPLPGTEGSGNHFLSPDGEWIGFETQEGPLKKISTSSLEIYTLSEFGGWGTWGDDGFVIFCHNNELWRVSETGGEPELLAAPVPEKGISAMIRPELLPGGKGLIFEIGRGRHGGVGVLSLDTGEMKRITANGADPFYAPTGHIVFGRDSTLFAVPFDAQRLEITGKETHVLQGVRVENGGALQAVVSDDGMLVYAPAGATKGTQLTWVDQQGRTEAVTDQWRSHTDPMLSPDGKRIAVVVNDDGAADIWIVDADSGAMTPLTTSGAAWFPVWTPDGTTITFAEGKSAPFTIRSAPVDGGGQLATLLDSNYPIRPQAWHPDGEWLVFGETRGNRALFVFDVSAKTRTPLFEGDADWQAASLSPDGRRLAYQSDKSGVDAVYVRAFPGPGPEVAVSIGRGSQPTWSPEGSKIFYRDDRRFYVASMDGLRVTNRDPGLEAVSFFWGLDRAYDVSRDGERFLVLLKNEKLTRSRINVVLNWFDELKRAAPADR